MGPPSIFGEPGQVDEPRVAQEYSDVFTHVAAEKRAVIVRRNGENLAAVIPMEHLELLQELAGRAEAEKLALQIEWDRVIPRNSPPQDWFDADNNPFEPEEERAS